MHIKIGTAPDSWGIWFPENEKQIPWKRCLNEMQECGYKGIELGPWGYFPNESSQLKKELEMRNLKLTATTLMGDLTSSSNTDEMISLLDQMAALQLHFSEAQYVVLIDDCYTDLFTGELIRSKVLSNEEWSQLIENIGQVAEEAGVSIATVSKVINNKGLIGTDAKRRVLEATKKLNYRPNEMAKALTGQKTKMIGLLVSNLASPFFAELTRNIIEQCRVEGFNIMVCSTDSHPDKEKNCMSALIRQGVDSFIVSCDHYPKIIEAELKKRGLKGVFISTEPEKQDPAMPLITVDNYEGACQAVRHLLASNHKKVARSRKIQRPERYATVLFLTQ